MNGYRSPPCGWGRDGSREFGGGALSHRRHDDRFADHSRIRRDPLDYPGDDFYRERNKFDRPAAPPDWGHRDRGGRDSFFSNERRGYERRPPSPLPPPPPPPPPSRGGRWARDIRVRSRSPVRGGPQPKEYHRDMYMERGRDDRHGGSGIRRDRFGDSY